MNDPKYVNVRVIKNAMNEVNAHIKIPILYDLFIYLQKTKKKTAQHYSLIVL